jgi:hypothetical protein
MKLCVMRTVRRSASKNDESGTFRGGDSASETLADWAFSRAFA